MSEYENNASSTVGPSGPAPAQVSNSSYVIRLVFWHPDTQRPRLRLQAASIRLPLMWEV